MPASYANPASAPIMEQLGHLCRDRGLPDLATRLSALQRWIQEDLKDFEVELAALPRGARAVQKAANHLLDLGGKHLRPMCVALASRFGTGFGESARRLAIAVELVHTATLLHDDVVDMGHARRGAPTARMVYGNAVSIFAGDWLLVEALRSIRRAEVPGLLDLMLAIIEEMILAESLQLERRGQVRGDADEYFRIVEGKTAALFRWAMIAGGRAGGLGDDACAALEQFGLRMGVAFQAVDDCLDFGDRSDAEKTGKSLFVDLREGKITYPLILAMERDAALGPLLREALAETAEGEDLSPVVKRAVLTSLERTEALVDCRKLAYEQVALAIEHLDRLPDGDAKSALITVAEAMVYREK